MVIFLSMQFGGSVQLCACVDSGVLDVWRGGTGVLFAVFAAAWMLAAAKDSRLDSTISA